MKNLILIFLLIFATSQAQDLKADNMLMFQRDNGGWPKHYEEKEINFKRVYNR
jgi:hypothetical protein